MVKKAKSPGAKGRGKTSRAGMTGVGLEGRGRGFRVSVTASQDALDAALIGGGAVPLPFAKSLTGAQARAYEGANEAIDSALRLALTLTERCCQGHAEEALADFYRCVLGWMSIMVHDGVNIDAFLTRLGRPLWGNDDYDGCAKSPAVN